MDVKILIAFIVATVSIAVSHGTGWFPGNRLYTSFHCKDGSSSTCSRHNLKCDAGKKIFIFTAQYIFATTESRCPIKSTCRRRTGCCFDYRYDLCATDYTSNDLRNVLSKCHTQQSCTLSTPDGSKHAKCKMSRRWWHPRSKMFSHYAMSYISYECLPDPPTIRIANPTPFIGVRSGDHIMIKGSLKKGVSCWFAITNNYFYLMQTNNEQKSIPLSHGNLLSNRRYLVRNYNRRSSPKLMVNGPITDLMIELLSVWYHKHIIISWECSGTAVEESTARPTTSFKIPTTSTARPTTSTTRPTTSTTRPTTPTAKPTTPARPTTPGRPMTTTSRPTTPSARPTTSTTIPTTSTARPTTSTTGPTRPTARPITTPIQIFTTTDEADETIIKEMDNTELEDMLNVTTDDDLKEIQGEIVVFESQSSDINKGLNLPMLIGGAIGGFLLLIIITFIVALFCKRRSNAAFVLKAKDVGAGVTNPTYDGFEPKQYVYQNSQNDDASSTYSDVSSKSKATRKSSTASAKSIPSQFADLNAQKSIDLNM